MLRTKRGFTLIEMAIVLVIVGLILATTLPLLTERIAKDKATKGARTVNTLKQEIIGYAILEGHLPTTDYVADNFSGAEDVWGNSVLYVPAVGLTGASGSGDTISSVSETTLTLTRSTSTGDKTYENMAFILVSAGQNMSPEVDDAGGKDTGVAMSPQVVNEGNSFVADRLSSPLEFAGDIRFYTRGGYSSASGLSYDDIVDYVSLEYLQTKVDNKGLDSPTDTVGSFDANGIASVLSSGYQQPGSTTQTSGANPIVLDTLTNELDLGVVSGASGCTWFSAENATIIPNPHCTDHDTAGVVYCYPGMNDAGDDWTSLHFVMRFNFLNEDNYLQTTMAERYATSFTFAIISAQASANVAAVAPCGSGNGAGMAHGGYASYASGTIIDDPKFGIEVDAHKENGQSDTNTDSDKNDADDALPAANVGDPGYNPPDRMFELNHIAAVYWEFDNSFSTAAVNHEDDNQHGLQDGAPGADLGDQGNENVLYDVTTNATGMIAGQPAADGTMWFEDSNDHWLRVELHRSNTTRAHTGGSTVTYTTYIFYDDTPNATFMDVSTAMGDTAGAGNYEQKSASSVTFDLGSLWNVGGTDYNVNEMMNRFRFGWTTATGNLTARSGQSVNTVSIGKFGWGLTPIPAN